MDLISLPTIFICIFIAMSAIALAMLMIWINNRGERAAGYWSIAFALGALAGVTMAIQGPAEAVGLILAASVNTAAYMAFWNGYRAFNNLRTFPATITIFPAIQILLMLAFPILRSDPNATLALQSAIITVVTLISIQVILNEKSNRELSATYLIVTFMFIHASFHTANIFFARLLPATVEAGRMHAPWLKLFMLEAFLNVIVLATACLMLIKERSEQRHRIASETDVLTGIANRRAFVKHTETALKNATPSAILAVFDLDHFKTINDRFGHQAGDAALIHFAHTLKERLPDDVLFGRMGGEEFALYVPDHNERDALVLVDGLRRAVETSDLRHLGEGIDMTVSVGVATVEDAGLYLDSLMAAADCALYQAKEDGRNRVVSFSPSQRLNQVIERDGRKRFGLAERRVSRRVARPAAPVRNVLP